MSITGDPLFIQAERDYRFQALSVGHRTDEWVPRPTGGVRSRLRRLLAGLRPGTHAPESRANPAPSSAEVLTHPAVPADTDVSVPETPVGADLADRRLAS